MAVLAKSSAFWKTVRQVSVSAIAREAERPVRLIVIGNPQGREVAERELWGAAGRGASDEADLLFENSDPETGFPETLGPNDIVVDLGGGLAPGTAIPQYYNVEELGGWNRLIERLLDLRPDLWLTLGRNYPGLRRRIADRIVHETALANAEFAMLNALPGVLPIIAPLLPATAIGDIVLLTKNQAMMMYRLAAAYGLPLDIRARSRDLAPLLGNAFGWRAIARELVAVVPGGVGVAARGAIAYSGTAALGRAIVYLYQTGRSATRAQITRFYKDAYAGARRIAAERLKAIRTQPREREKLPAAPKENGTEEDNRGATG